MRSWSPLEIANQYDKNFILELYLNEVFFANQNYGVEAASQFYFGHGADELNYAEAALLASIVPSPAKNDPVTNRPVAVQGMARHHAQDDRHRLPAIPARRMGAERTLLRH